MSPAFTVGNGMDPFHFVLLVLKAVETAGVRYAKGSENYIKLLEKEIRQTKLKNSIFEVSFDLIISFSLISTCTAILALYQSFGLHT